MFSYVFMKILENRPERYDTGINILSGGHAKKIRKHIVQNYVKPDMDVLDVGCGTGSLIIDAAKTGARATGVDISAGMLEVAQKRISRNGMQERITLHNVGVVEIDSVFEDNSFDLIISTLVFSELYYEEVESMKESTITKLSCRNFLHQELIVSFLKKKPEGLAFLDPHILKTFPCS